MKRTIFTLLYILSVLMTVAQTYAGTTRDKMAFNTFLPAKVTKTNGKTTTLKQANIFLKNSHLLFKFGSGNMEALINDIATVDFPNRRYVRVDSVLAYIVDTIGTSRLLCTTMIDMQAYRTQVKNNREFTNVEIGNQVSVNTVAIDPDADNVFPLVNYYYFNIGEKTFKASERTVRQNIPKEKHRIMDTIISMPEFAWGDPQSLMKLLSAIIE